MAGCCGSSCGRKGTDLSPAFMLCSVLFSPPDDESYRAYLEDVCRSHKLLILLENYEANHSSRFSQILFDLIQDSAVLSEASVDYEKLFLDSSSQTTLYVSDLLSESGLQSSYLHDLDRLYGKYNFSIDDGSFEKIDHLAVMFEFYTSLLMRFEILAQRNEKKTAGEVLRDKFIFLNQFLAQGIKVIGESEALKKDPNFFAELFQFAQVIIADEQEQMGAMMKEYFGE